MKLIMSPASPYVRKVRVLIREMGLSEAITEQQVITTAFNSDSSVIAANPMGKIPALVRNDAPTLYDSRVITRFLNDTHDGTFYPSARMWETLTLEATGDGIMDCVVSMSYETRLRPEADQSPDWIEAQWQKAARAIKAVNDRWMSHLSGPLDISHISVGCALSYIDFRHDVRNWRNGNGDLAKWHADFVTRDSMQATKPD